MQNLEREAREEMELRKTRHHKQKVFFEAVAGACALVLIIAVILLAMTILPD